jgi:hypothetical protein
MSRRLHSGRVAVDAHRAVRLDERTVEELLGDVIIAGERRGAATVRDLLTSVVT